MKKNILVVLILIIMTLGVVQLFLSVHDSRDVEQEPKQSLPSAQTNNNVLLDTKKIAEPIINIYDVNKNALSVNNFMNSTTTIVDPVNPGHYILYGDLGYCLPDGYCPKTGGDEFLITYSTNDDFISVLILTEPYSGMRTRAEKVLLGELGISESELCRTNHSVNIPRWVDERWGSQELGFSFCPDSIVLY